ncbi:motility protein A [Desulfofustis glycolicus]|uniref:Chemotaxis protein MotA n=1 Tax=Desulfofustis glycolicus DSM 9705 TaxID=1121409 RepID=A0A1M5U1W7_9BACT|nr:MotA/TolQ/ExbB proton channel family protein [Desulfofustis glycolicus]MCB2214708.1 MotA/TolQ/ExbB proton channel family protein [Desulfobulbaceae bacterium]SHH56851.1 chemotaxis protein MotA [Desulfofustis glycolicus DSM 9705]
MDLSTIIGMGAAFGLMLMAILQGGPLTMFINIPSVLIVVGGTAGVAFVQYPARDLLDAVNVAKKTVLHKEASINDMIMQLMGFANKARKEGILALQSEMEKIDDEFLVKAMQMAVDGQEPDTLRGMLNTEIDYIQQRHEKGANIFISLGTISPAMGMVGTLIGLVQMLQTMDDPSKIGPAMAVALLTTFYGAVLANVMFLPMAGKLRLRSESEMLIKTLIIEGMQSILSGENPRIMEQKLHSFIAPKMRESTFNR